MLRASIWLMLEEAANTNRIETATTLRSIPICIIHPRYFRLPETISEIRLERTEPLRGKKLAITKLSAVIQGQALVINRFRIRRAGRIVSCVAEIIDQLKSEPRIEGFARFGLTAAGFQIALRNDDFAHVGVAKEHLLALAVDGQGPPLIAQAQSNKAALNRQTNDFDGCLLNL